MVHKTKPNHAYASKKGTCRGEEKLTGGREGRKNRVRVIRMHYIHAENCRRTHFMNKRDFWARRTSICQLHAYIFKKSKRGEEGSRRDRGKKKERDRERKRRTS